MGNLYKWGYLERVLFISIQTNLFTIGEVGEFNGLNVSETILLHIK